MVLMDQIEEQSQNAGSYIMANIIIHILRQKGGQIQFRFSKEKEVRQNSGPQNRRRLSTIRVIKTETEVLQCSGRSG